MITLLKEKSDEVQGIEVICLFFPAVISLNIDMKINKEKLDKKSIIKYITYNFIINLIASLLIWFITDDKTGTYFYTFSFVVKYMITTLLISIILPITIKLQKTYIKIKIKEKENA